MARPRGPETGAQATWSEALNVLRLRMGRATFETWLRGTRVQAQAGNEWVIGVANDCALDWLQHRLAGTVALALQQVTGGPVAVRFVVASKPAAAAPPAEAAAEEEADLEPEPATEAGSEDRAAPAGGGALQWTDFYIKLKVAFRKRGLRRLKGAKLAVFLCLALHVDRGGWAKPGGIVAIMRETGYSRSAVCSALAGLEACGLIRKLHSRRGPDEYAILGYAWFGQRPAPSLWETGRPRSGE